MLQNHSIFQQRTWLWRQLNLRSPANKLFLLKVHWLRCEVGCTVGLCTAQSRRQPCWQSSSASRPQIEILFSCLACENYFLHAMDYVQALQWWTPRKPIMEKNAYVSGTATVAGPGICVQVLMLLQGSNAEGPLMQCRGIGYVKHTVIFPIALKSESILILTSLPLVWLYWFSTILHQWGRKGSWN